MSAAFSAWAPIEAAWATKSISGCASTFAVLVHVVELGAAALLLQPVDAAVAAVVGQHDGEGDAPHHRGGELGVRHHVGAVADEADHLLRRIGELDPHGAGDLVAHAGVAVLHVVAALGRLPEHLQRARHGAGGAHGDGVLGRHPLHRADHLGVGGELVGVLRRRGGDLGDGGVPVGAGLGVGRGEARVAEGGVDLLERHLGVADDADGAVLQRVVAVDVDRDELAVGVGEDRPRAGGEVLEAGADADDEVGRRAGVVAAGRAGDAGRAEVHRVLPGGRALAGLGLDDRDVAARGEVGEQVLGAGVEHAAAGDDHRRLRGADRGDDLGDLDRVGLGAADAPDPRLEEALGVVEGLGLHVLAEGEADRAAVGRVGHACAARAAARSGCARAGRCGRSSG